MTVMFPPQVRLNRTRIAVTTRLRLEAEDWKKSIASAVNNGAGMIIVTAPTPVSDLGASDSNPQAKAVVIGAALSTARQAGSHALVGVAEPVPRKVLTDAVLVESIDHLPLWNGVLAGIEVHTPAEVDAVIASNAAFLVVDWRTEGLLEHAVQAVKARPDLVWFVRGLASLNEVEQAVDLGARRVWLDETDTGYGAITLWSTYLRGVWRADPEMHELILGRFVTRRLL